MHLINRLAYQFPGRISNYGCVSSFYNKKTAAHMNRCLIPNIDIEIF